MYFIIPRVIQGKLRAVINSAAKDDCRMETRSKDGIRGLLVYGLIVTSMAACCVSCGKVAQELGKKGSQKAAGVFLATKVPTSARSQWKDLARDQIGQFAVDYAANRASSNSSDSANSGNSEEEIWMRQVDMELTSAITEGRAYAQTGVVRVIGIILVTRVYVDKDGVSFLVAHVQSSHNPLLGAGDIIFSANGMLFTPGRDLTRTINLPGSPDNISLGVIRGDWVGEIVTGSSIIQPNQNEVADRRVVDAVEKVWIDHQVETGAIQNPAW